MRAMYTVLRAAGTGAAWRRFAARGEFACRFTWSWARKAQVLSYQEDGDKMTEYDWALAGKYGFQERAALQEYEAKEPHLDCSVDRVRSSYGCEDVVYIVNRMTRIRGGSLCFR